jgi:TatA/E family protein of Tat protein translocase
VGGSRLTLSGLVAIDRSDDLLSSGVPCSTSRIAVELPLRWRLDGSVDCKAGNPLYRALVNLPIALSMPGWPETLFILVVVVLLFGAKKLPELARGLGQSLGEFKKEAV